MFYFLWLPKQIEASIQFLNRPVPTVPSPPLHQTGPGWHCSDSPHAHSNADVCGGTRRLVRDGSYLCRLLESRGGGNKVVRTIRNNPVVTGVDTVYLVVYCFISNTIYIHTYTYIYTYTYTHTYTYTYSYIIYIYMYIHIHLIYIWDRSLLIPGNCVAFVARDGESNSM